MTSVFEFNLGYHVLVPNFVFWMLILSKISTNKLVFLPTVPILFSYVFKSFPLRTTAVKATRISFTIESLKWIIKMRHQSEFKTWVIKFSHRNESQKWVIKLTHIDELWVQSKVNGQFLDELNSLRQSETWPWNKINFNLTHVIF